MNQIGNPLQKEVVSSQKLSTPLTLEEILTKLKSKTINPEERLKLIEQKKALNDRSVFAVRQPEKINPLLKIEDKNIRNRFKLLLNKIPEKYRKGYLQRLEGSFKEQDEIAYEGALGGLILELERINSLLENNQEEIDFDQKKLKVHYRGYKKDTKWHDLEDSKKEIMVEMDSTVDSDIPVKKNGKPYIYEVKKYNRMIFGRNLENLNQLLKYNQAVEDIQASGATFEIKGRLDPIFLKWLLNSDDPVPDVEIIYCLDLPSGKEYQFILKPSQKSKLNINIHDSDYFEEQDKKMMSGIKKSFEDRSIIELLTAFDELEAPEEIRPFINKPWGIKQRGDKMIETLEQLKKYEDFIYGKIQERLMNKSD